MPWQPAAALLLGLLALGGCDDESSAFVEIGTGERVFEWSPLEPGQEVGLHAGIQGGYHVWGALRGDGFEPRDIDYVFALWDGERQVGGVNYVDEARRGPTGDYEVGGVTVFVNEDVDVASLDGKRIRMTLELRSTDGAHLKDDVEVVTRCCVELAE